MALGLPLSLKLFEALRLESKALDLADILANIAGYNEEILPPIQKWMIEEFYFPIFSMSD